MIHLSAEISSDARIAPNVQIWAFSRIREDAVVGRNSKIGGNVYIDRGVKIGANVKIEDGALVYSGSVIEAGVFIGPGACLVNDKYPRAIDSMGVLRNKRQWRTGKILVKRGASLGAGCVVLPNVVIGRWALAGAGSVVIKSVPDFCLVFGNPVKIDGLVCKAGHIMKLKKETKASELYYCKVCNKQYKIKNGA